MSSFAQKQVLELRLNLGEVYKLETEMPVQISLETDDEIMEMKMDLKMDLSYKVIKIEPTYYEFEVQFNHISSTMIANETELSFSTESENPSDLMNAFVKEITKNIFYIKTTKNGDSIEMKGFEELLEKSCNQLSNITNSEKEHLKKQFKQNFQELIIKQNTSNFYNYFPSYPVGVGDEWNYQFSTSIGTLLKGNAHFKLKEITKDYILIEIQTVIQYISELKDIDFNGIKLNFDLDGTIHSIIKLDPKTCWIKQSNIIFDLYMLASDDLPNGIEIDLNIKCNMNINDGTSGK